MGKAELKDVFVYPSNRDKTTGGVKSIDTDHSYIHEGIAFTGFFMVQALAAGASRYLEFRTGDVEKIAHFKPINLQPDGERFLLQLIEMDQGDVFTPGTTEVPLHNRKRRRKNLASKCKLFSNPTYTSGGVIIDQDYLGGGSGGPAGNATSIGQDGGTKLEWELAPLTSYLIKLTNQGDATASCNVKVLVYDEDPVPQNSY